MVDVERHPNGARVSLVKPPLEDQIERQRLSAERDKAYWHAQVRKRMCNEVHAAQQICMADAIVESLERLLLILGPTPGLAPPSSPCRSCGAPIVWLKTASGKSMPVDAASVRYGDKKFEPPRHVTHFSTCPNADQHRKEAP